MGLIKTIIIIAICVAIFCVVFNFAHIPQDEYDCLEEIAEDYCEDNDMSLGMVYVGVGIGKVFACEKDERSLRYEVYKFLEEEIEECRD